MSEFLSSNSRRTIKEGVVSPGLFPKLQTVALSLEKNTLIIFINGLNFLTEMLF